MPGPGAFALAASGVSISLPTLERQARARLGSLTEQAAFRRGPRRGAHLR